jgi:hypothetical protein
MLFNHFILMLKFIIFITNIIKHIFSYICLKLLALDTLNLRS